MAYAAAADVVTLWAREPEPEVLALVDRRPEQVERMILRRIPDLADQIRGGKPDEVIDIEAEAILRVVRNPEGFHSEQDGNCGYQLSREAADDSLSILPEEWQTLGLKTESDVPHRAETGGGLTCRFSTEGPIR